MIGTTVGQESNAVEETIEQEETQLTINSFEVYEDLNKNKSDRFEYVFPNFQYEKRYAS